MRISTRSQNSTLTHRRYECDTRVNIGWFAVKGAEARLPSYCVCRAFLSGPTGHQKLNGFPCVFHGTELVFPVDHQLHAAVPDIIVHQFLHWRPQRSIKEVCSWTGALTCLRAEEERGVMSVKHRNFCLNSRLDEGLSRLVWGSLTGQNVGAHDASAFEGRPLILWPLIHQRQCGRMSIVNDNPLFWFSQGEGNGLAPNSLHIESLSAETSSKRRPRDVNYDRLVASGRRTKVGAGSKYPSMANFAFEPLRKLRTCGAIT
jgi:hypothetical protein